VKVIQELHHSGRHISVEGVIGGEDPHSLLGKPLLPFKIRLSHFYAQIFGFLGTGNNTAIIVRQHHYRFLVKAGIKDPLTGNIEIITIYQCKHILSFKTDAPQR